MPAQFAGEPMRTEIFYDLVKKYFNYLIDRYGFSISTEDPIVGNPLWRGRIVYVSGKNNSQKRQVAIRITLDRGYVLLDIGSPDLQSRDWFDLSEIIKVVEPEIVVYDKPDYSQGPVDILEPQIRKLSDLVLHYCASFINGDFSLGNRIIESRLQEREQRIKEWKNKQQGKS
jgi:hypothetical protein